MKKSFVLYTDNYEPIKGLTQEQKGDLLDAIFKYNIDGTEDIDDNFVATVFGFFKIHFKRDKEKWEAIAERNKKNGKLGGRPKKKYPNPEEPKKPSGLSGNPDEPKKAVIGIVSGIDIVNGNENNISTEIKNFVADYQKYAVDTFGPSAKKVTESLISNGSDAIDKLIRLDGFTLTEVSDAIRWASTDDFWASQIKSLASLRKKSKNDMTKFQNLFNSFKRSKTKTTGSEITDHNLAAAREFLNG